MIVEEWLTFQYPPPKLELNFGESVVSNRELEWLNPDTAEEAEEPP